MAKILKDFLERIDIEQDKLRKQRSLLEQATYNPELWFDKASEIVRTKDVLFKIMNVYENDQRKMDSHELQRYIGSLLNTFFKNKFPGMNVSVKESSTMCFPSIYSVCVDEGEVVRFNVYEKFYGRLKYRNREQLKSDYNERYDELHEEIKALKEKTADMRKARENTLKYIVKYHKEHKQSTFKKFYHGTKEIIYYLPKTKKVHMGIDNKIVRLEARTSEINEFLRRHVERGSGVETFDRLENAAKPIIEVFEKYGYRYETENHKLY